MPTVRLTYSKDIKREGRKVIDVSDGRARVLLNQRRAVIVEDADVLLTMTKQQLVDHATPLGLEFGPRASKAEMIAAIRGADKN
jgi:hypothetical protein